MLARMFRGQSLSEQNAVLLITGGQYTGRAPRRVGQVHTDLMTEPSYILDLENVTDIIAEIDEFSIDISQDPERCMEVLKEVLSKLTNFEARRQRDENGEDPQTKYAKIFMEFGGIEVLLRLLMMNSLLPESHSDEDNALQLRVKSVALEILSRIISTEPGDALAKRLTSYDDVMNHIFTYLAYDMTCLTACQVLEDLLQARQSVLNLNTIKNVKRLVLCLDDKKLANFCRVLAVTISDLDIYEDKSSLYAQHRQKNAKGFVNVRDVNQEMLLGIQDLVPRLVNIAVANDYAPRYRDMSSELDCWMKWIDDKMSDDAFEPMAEDDLDKFVGGISEPVQFGGPMNKQAGLDIAKELILRVKVIYVLGLFLAGKARKKVQRKLAELQLIPGLSGLFEHFIWKCQGSSHRNNSRNRLRGHNSSCECSPEVALKIQFLRLVHSFCDHSDYKHLLLTKSELSELKRINSKAGPLEIDGLDKVNKSLMCKGSKGLLTKIVEVMKKEPTASTFRFWLARAVESYLRGNTSFCDQVFLLKKGLLQHIACNIVEHDIRPKEILQSSFDLLGELVKFNVEAFKAFDKVLDTQDRADKFLSLVNKNLVDSNMFIRALILSLEQLTVTQPEYKSYSTTESFLLVHISKFEKQVTYLKKLINVINVQNLTQENVSCLNTTLVFLMFAHRRREMPRYLRALMMDSAGSASRVDCTSNLSIMKNFRDLLTFWQDHYLHKDKDCSALEKSSRLKFEYWKETVATLLSEDWSQDSSVLHYLDPDNGRHS